MMARAGLAVAAGAFCLMGCAQLPQDWKRTDGLAIGAAQLQADTLACKADVEKAAVQGQARSTVASPLGADAQDTRLFVGCMADRGYLPR